MITEKNHKLLTSQLFVTDGTKKELASGNPPLRLYPTCACGARSVPPALNSPPYFINGDSYFNSFWEPWVYRPPYPWYIDAPYSWYLDPPYPWYIDPPTHGILTSLPMVYRPPYPWYIDPPHHGISNPLLWYYELLSFGRNEGGFKIQWQKIDPRVKIPYGKLNPGSKYHMTPVHNLLSK